MSLYLWLALVMILLFAMSGMLFFRRGIAGYLAKYPEFSKIVAIILVIVLLILSLMPLLVWWFK